MLLDVIGRIVCNATRQVISHVVATMSPTIDLDLNLDPAQSIERIGMETFQGAIQAVGRSLMA